MEKNTNITLNTQYFVISLEQIEDIRLLEALHRNCSEKNALRGRVFDSPTESDECLILGLLYNDQKAVIIRDNKTDMETVYFSQLNIDIAFDFAAVS